MYYDLNGFNSLEQNILEKPFLKFFIGYLAYGLPLWLVCMTHKSLLLPTLSEDWNESFSRKIVQLTIYFSQLHMSARLKK